MSKFAFGIHSRQKRPLKEGRYIFTQDVDKTVNNHRRESMDLNARLALKERLAKVLSEALSDQYDCNITITFKPEKDEVIQ